MVRTFAFALAGVAATSVATADVPTTQQQLVEYGFASEAIESSEIVRTVPAPAATRTEERLVEAGFRSQPVERTLETEQRVTDGSLPEDPVERNLVEWGFKPAPARTVSTLVGADGSTPSRSGS